MSGRVPLLSAAVPPAGGRVPGEEGPTRQPLLSRPVHVSVDDRTSPTVSVLSSPTSSPSSSPSGACVIRPGTDGHSSTPPPPLPLPPRRPELCKHRSHPFSEVEEAAAGEEREEKEEIHIYHDLGRQQARIINQILFGAAAPTTKVRLDTSAMFVVDALHGRDIRLDRPTSRRVRLLRDVLHSWLYHTLVVAVVVLHLLLGYWEGTGDCLSLTSLPLSDLPL